MEPTNAIHFRWYEPAFSECIRKHRNAKGQHNRETFGTWLAQQMKAKGMSTYGLARELGDTNMSGQISKYMNDYRRPSLATVTKIARALGINEDTAIDVWESYK